METVPKHEQMLEVARNFRNEQEQQQTRMQQKQDQRNQVKGLIQKWTGSSEMTWKGGAGAVEGMD